MKNPGLDEAQAIIKIPRRNINKLSYADNTIFMAESEEELKSLLMKVKEKSEKFGLKFNIQKTKIMASGPITSWQIDGETVETVAGFIWGGGALRNHCRLWLQPWNKKTLTPWKENYDQPREHVKKQRHYFANKRPSSQGYGFSSSHVWMWELDYKERWTPKNWCFWTVVLEKPPESPLYSKEIKLINLKGNQPWIFIEGTDVEAEAPILLPPDAKSWLVRKDPDAGKDWRWEEKRVAEDETVGWHHWLNEHEFEQTPGDSEGLGSLLFGSPWGRRVGHKWETEQQQCNPFKSWFLW